jgi:hypothetical protein
MIRYTLKCDQDHSFESWFKNGAAYDVLRAAGHIICPDCGSTQVEKGLMAPKVRPARSAAKPPALPSDAAPAVQAPSPTVPRPPSPSPEVEAEIAKLRAKVESESEYVGGSFASEARAMHLGDAPERAIYGEAKLEDAKELLDDGISVMPLPFVPKQKMN